MVLVLNVTLASAGIEGVALLALTWSACDAILHAIAARKALGPTVIPTTDGINHEVRIGIAITGEWVLLVALLTWGGAGNLTLACAGLFVQEKTASVVADLISAVCWLVAGAGCFVKHVAILALLEVSGRGVGASAVRVDLVALLAGQLNSVGGIASAVTSLSVALSAGKSAVTISILLVLGTLVGVSG